MSDLISRQAAIDEAEKWFFNLKDKRTIGEVLKGLPSEQPETNCSEFPNNWIPCSERLPEEHEWVGTKRFGTTISDEVYVTFETPDGQRFANRSVSGRA